MIIIDIINNRKERGYQKIEDLKNEIIKIKNEVSSIYYLILYKYIS